MPEPAGRHSVDRAPAAARSLVVATAQTEPGLYFAIPVCFEQGNVLLQRLLYLTESVITFLLGKFFSEYLSFDLDVLKLSGQLECKT